MEESGLILFSLLFKYIFFKNQLISFDFLIIFKFPCGYHLYLTVRMYHMHSSLIGFSKTIGVYSIGGDRFDIVVPSIIKIDKL